MACSLNVFVNSITGDCSSTSSGGFVVNIDGTAPNYTLQWINPYSGSTVIITGSTYTFTGLTAGTYTFNVIDSCIPFNNNSQINNVYISSGTCIEIQSVSNTYCNLTNGQISVLLENNYGNPSFLLYEKTLGLITQIDSVDTQSSFVSFGQLTPGVYYVVGDDGGGCTGKTESCIIKSSTTFSYGLYVIQNSACAINTGAIYVTGLTGTPPYTYVWSNGSTASSISALTEGDYSVTVTDLNGCSEIRGVTLTSVPSLSIISLNTVNPTCFSANGEVTVYITGGTAPYFYAGSNGENTITFSDSYVFTGLSAGNFQVTVTDAGLCQATDTIPLLTPNSISLVNVTTTNSICNNSGGEINVSIFGGSAPYTYTLTDSLSNTSTFIQPLQNGGASFLGLSSGNYTLTIVDSAGSCSYSQSYTISNTVLFTLTASSTGTTCGQDNGSTTLSITTGGTAPYTYQIEGQSYITNDLSYTFSGLPSGSYVASVTDLNLCQQLLPFTIQGSSSVNFILNGYSPIDNDGFIETFILDGEPPFTLNWSSNVNGQTGLTVSNLSAGTYSLTVTDSSGCTQVRTLVLDGYNVFTSYEVYSICNKEFVNNSELIKKGLQQMLVEGFNDLTSGDTNCILNSASFELVTTVDGVQKNVGFYVSAGLNDFPADNIFYNTVEVVLLTYPNIESVDINPKNGDLTISTVCNPPISIMDATVTIDVKIYYDISCVSCDVPVESPYIFEVDVSLAGSTGSGKFVLPLELGGTYDFNVEWGDGNFDTINTWNDPLAEHTYGILDNYTIKITGQLSGWTFNNGGDKEKMVEVKQWGILELGDSPGGFHGCNNLVLTGVTDFINLSTTSKLDNTFTDCFNVASINNIEYWDTSTITSMINIFQSTQFNQDISSWDVSNVIDMSFMFNGTQFDQDISSWDVSNVVNMSGMFLQTPFNQPIDNWDVSNVTNMFAMFNITPFDQDISSWDVSNVTDMSGMFNSSSFNQPLSAWNVSNVINMAGMFSYTPFNQSIDNWDVSSVTNMSLMFNSSSFNQPLNSWNVSNVVDISNTFDSTPFDQDISSWDVSNVLNMGGTFFNSSFNQPLSGWNVSNVTDMASMFDSSLFNQDISSWNVINVFNMKNMFNNSPFNQDISSWNVSNVLNMVSMLDNCSMSQTNYETLLVGWNSLPSLQIGVNFGVNGLQYQIGSSADISRSNIIASYTWTFVGDTAVP